MSDTDHYFISRAEQQQLAELLDQIPDLVEDLTIAISRQDRITGGGPRTRNGSDEQPIPIGLHAMEAADLLHATLTAWTNHVCEQRNYPRPRNDTLTLGRWLKQHMIALALTEGAEESLDEIRHAIRQARRATDRPTERTLPEPDAHKVAEADRMVLGVRGIATLAKEMGGKFAGLTMRRVRYLAGEANMVEPVHVAGLEKLYRVGDVRRAHIALLEAQQQQEIA